MPYAHRKVIADFQRVLRLAGLAGCNFNSDSMRHTFASLHILNGKSTKWIPQQMGHSSIRVALDTYGDWFKLQDHDATDELPRRSAWQHCWQQAIDAGEDEADTIGVPDAQPFSLES